MNVVILTQDTPFYLAENLDYLISNMPEHSKITGCVVFDSEPFGKKRPLIEQAKDTYQTFGFSFFMRYGMRFVRNKMDKNKKVEHILEKHNIPIIKLEKKINHKDSVALIKSYQPDLLISILGNQIFKKPIIELAPKGCLNLHTALLPKYRGLMPSFWVLKNGEKETGVSVFFVDEGIDSGPILVQKRVPIPPDMTQEQLITQTKKLGMDAIIESIEKIHHGGYELIPNPEEEKTYFSRPQRKDVVEFLNNGKRFY